MLDRRALFVAALSLGAVTPALAQTEIQWWHAMTGGNNEVVVKLAEEFNASQKDYKVVPSYKGSYPDTMNAAIAAFRAGGCSDKNPCNLVPGSQEYLAYAHDVQMFHDFGWMILLGMANPQIIESQIRKYPVKPEARVTYHQI